MKREDSEQPTPNRAMYEKTEAALREKQRHKTEGEQLLRSMLAGDIRPEDILSIIESSSKALLQSQKAIDSGERIISNLERQIAIYQEKETIYQRIIANFENNPRYQRAKAKYLKRHPQPRRVHIKSDVAIKAITGHNIKGVKFV